MKFRWLQAPVNDIPVGGAGEGKDGPADRGDGAMVGLAKVSARGAGEFRGYHLGVGHRAGFPTVRGSNPQGPAGTSMSSAVVPDLIV